MAYKRRYRRRRRYRRKPWYNKSYTPAQMAGKALSTAMYLKKLINVEYKYLDTSFGNSTINTSGTFQDLSVIPQGDGPNGRDGYSVKLQSLHIKANLQSYATGERQQLRFIIVQSNNDDNPTLARYLESSTDGTLQFRNIDYTNELKTLYDKTHVLDFRDPSQRQLNINIKHFPISHCEWVQSDTAGTSHKKGQIFVLLISDTATNGPSCQFLSRLRYTDN